MWYEQNRQILVNLGQIKNFKRFASLMFLRPENGNKSSKRA